MRESAYRVLCAIGGWDPTGGAGLAADIETFAAHDYRACGVLTALTVQGRAGVTSIAPRPASEVAKALEAAVDAQSPAGIKVGMLGKASTARVLERAARRLAPVPWVLDPVLAAGAGGALLAPAALPALLRLASRAQVVTPNLPEALQLLGRPASDTQEDPVALARQLHRLLGGPAILLKGGHGSGPTVVDILIWAGVTRRFAHTRVQGPTLHGTGCTLAAALLARLADGADLVEATELSIAYVRDAIAVTQREQGWCLRRPQAAPTPVSKVRRDPP